MRLVKVDISFFEECKKRHTEKELLFNENGRPSVLLVKLKYKGNNHDFVVPLRSNISPTTPKCQYFPLPPTSKTTPHHSHGVHYIKLFPITDKYIAPYLVSTPFDIMVKKKLERNKKVIITACQDYLASCELGNKHTMTPDIDGILSWL